MSRTAWVGCCNWGWVSTAAKIAKCAAILAAEIAGNLLLISKVRKLGGAAKAAKKVHRAIKDAKAAGRSLSNTQALDTIYKAIGAAGADVFGLTAVYNSCVKVWL